MGDGENPKYDDMMLPVLGMVAAGHQTTPTLVAPIARHFALTAEALERTVPSGAKTEVVDRIGWALTYLFKAGLVQRERRGVYAISDRGQEVLAAPPSKIDRAFLLQFEGFGDFVSRPRTAVSGRAQANDLPAKTDDDLSDQTTPEDRIAEAFAELDAALRDELLAAVLTLSPARFEDLVVQLLLAMGYGKGDPAMGQRLGRSGDGGVDGIVAEDALGLDAVYIQAKRYATENAVGAPALRDFVGAMNGEGATKGVFVTTSRFSREVEPFLTRVPQRIVLIDGDRLAGLMIAHGVGVRVRRTYALATVDEDTFAEPT